MRIMKAVATTGLLLVMGMSVAVDHSMGFFVTGVGMGKGGDPGGVAGTDAHCAMLAKAAGSSGRM